MDLKQRPYQTDPKNYEDNLIAKGNQSHTVGRKQANAWQLYDMLGNVVEWTHTFYTVQLSQETINPTGPSTAEYKSLRGGGWWDGRNRRC